MIFTHFDRVVVLTLQRRTDRQAKFCRDWADFDFDAEWYYGDDKPDGCGKKGCHLSHAKMLTEAYIRGERWFIMEDDAVPKAGADFDIRIPWDTGMLFCGSTNKVDERVEDIPGWYKFPNCKGWNGTYAYGFMNLEAQSTFLDHVLATKFGVNFDLGVQSTGLDITMRRPVNCPIKHRSGKDSDITQR